MRLRSVLLKLFQGLLYAIVAAAFYRLTDSTFLWLCISVGTISLLERGCFQVVCQTTRHQAVTCFAKYSAVLLLGAVGAVCIWGSALSWSETIHIGLMPALMIAALDLIADLAHRARQCISPDSRIKQRPTWNYVFAGLIVMGLIVIAPVVSTVHLIHRLPSHSPADLNLPFEEVALTTADRVRLAGWYIPAAEPRGVVIFCHGHGAHRGQVLGMLDTFVQSNLDVLAFDFRGHGASHGHTLTFGHREVEDVIAAHELARRRLPGKPVFLVGVSYGASVTLQALPRLPDVHGAWVEAPFSRFSNVAEHKFSRVPPAIARPMLSVCYLVTWMDCGFWPQQINPIEKLNDVRTPIAFVHGRKDELVPFREGELLYASYRGPKECFWVEDANHFSLFSNTRSEYQSRLSAFLEGRLSAATRSD